MVFFQENMWWIGGFLLVTIFCIALMLWRNHAAKSDTVLRKESDTVASSISLKPKRNIQKLD
jgi:hypothetical protein